MICCYQVTKIFSTRYSSTIASSAWVPCNFGPFTDLAISVSREMIFNTVLTQILTSLECGLYRYFMRRTGVRVYMYWNFIIHQIFPEFLQHSGISEHNESLCSFLDSFIFGFWILLAWLSSGRPDLSSTVVDTCTERCHSHFELLVLEFEFHLL